MQRLTSCRPVHWHLNGASDVLLRLDSRENRFWDAVFKTFQSSTGQPDPNRNGLPRESTIAIRNRRELRLIIR
ncbi:MAG: hypothetical protein OXG05_01240 [Gammaproteobacteria bacterium]|nr:hypothetical protein [Gammaproteobacteria bacterium]